MTLKNFGDLQPGDWVTGSDGLPVEVTAVHDEHLPETMWEIELDSGETIQVSGNHLWYVETLLDWELLADRRKRSRKALRGVSPEALKLLEETAAHEEIVETALVDMVTLLQAHRNEELLQVITRVAESIGHVAENTATMDALDEGQVTGSIFRSYDARVFAQQLLKLTGARRYRKTNLIVGSIVTTEQMLELGDSAELPRVAML